MKFQDLNHNNSTIVVFEGKEYRTTQNPHVNNDGTHYTAHAVDKMNEEYTIEWEISVVDFENLEDESEACDWENPVSVISL
ncbi:hypothetical protein B4127_1538 [Bacillus pumilus]|uniref:Uncharacterized protein n=1 Tax=Bacillus pumilus TaxID=1408 RepID=A0AB34QPQ1_BACPU|nr:hypothetical protein [Bacillus pumilus]KIL12207.1 hypothetical protein B4127_1538 [Bacillus pumilus]MBU8573729.1 hypothetical protein [Bacillus pumilus]